MAKKLDYSATWAEAMGLLRAHREPVIAIAGFFIFMATWIFSLLTPPMNVASTDTYAQVMALWQAYFRANWMLILPMLLITTYGSFAIYVLLIARSLEKVGDALIRALVIFIPYVIASILTGWLTILGALAFLIPGLYLFGRFAVLPAVFARQERGGVFAEIKRAWSMTEGVGWRVFFLVLAVGLMTWLISTIASLIIGILTRLAAGPQGIPLVDVGFAALFGTAQAVIMVALIAAIHNQLLSQSATR